MLVGGDVVNVKPTGKFTVNGLPCVSTFAVACANLRARSYAVVERDTEGAMRIAGDIIPSIVTTVAATSALSSLEILKLACTGRKSDADGLYRTLDATSFSCNFVNLALPLFVSASPIECASVTHREWTWSTWDCIELTGPMTLAQLVELFEETYGVEVEMVSAGVCILYTFYQPRAKVEARMPMELAALLADVQGAPIAGGSPYITIEVCGTDVDTDEDVEIPACRYKVA
jgi:ubiquitin-activating enzyme E1